MDVLKKHMRQQLKISLKRNQVGYFGTVGVLWVRERKNIRRARSNWFFGDYYLMKLFLILKKDFFQHTTIFGLCMMFDY